MYVDKPTVLGDPLGGRGDHPVRNNAPRVKTIPSRCVSSVVFSPCIAGSVIHHHSHVRLPRTSHRTQPWPRLPRLRPNDTLFYHHVDVCVCFRLLSLLERSSVRRKGKHDLRVRDGGSTSFHGWKQQLCKRARTLLSVSARSLIFFLTRNSRSL